MDSKASKTTSYAAGLILGMILLAGSACARKFDRCGLTRELRSQVPGHQLATWVCIATHESSLDTTAINKHNTDGSWDHGLFQLNDRYWVGRHGRGGGCNLSADEVRSDNVHQAVQCALKIYAEHQRLSGNGFNAWAAFSRLGHCKSNVQSYIQGC